MTYYHVVIAQEFRKPVITEHRRYIGRYENVEIEEDGEIVVEQRKIDPDAWETYTEENRLRLAIPIGTSVATGNMVDGPMGQMPEFVSGPTQLHTSTDANLSRVVNDESLPPDFSDPQFVMVVEWDQKSPYVIVHKGDYHARTMTYAGWPEITQEEYDALPHPDHL